MSDQELASPPPQSTEKSTVSSTDATEAVSHSTDETSANVNTADGDQEEPSKRLFVRPINHDTSMDEVEQLFTTLGPVTDISLKPGYGFIEYEHLVDADKAIETFNGNTSLGYEIMVERAMARGSKRHGESDGGSRPSRPVALHRLLISGCNDDFSWQDLKDLSREQGVEAVFTKVDRDNVGVIDVASDADRESLYAIKEWKGFQVSIQEDPRGPAPPPSRGGRGRGRGRGGRFGDRRGGPRFGGYRGDRGDRGDRGGDRDRGDRFSDRRGDRFGDRRGGDRFADRRGSERFSDRRSYDDRSSRSRQDEPSW